MQRYSEFGLEILVNGRPLPVIRHNGKLYVAAPMNEDYQLRLKTPFGNRYLAVTSVDGLDIMTGKTASPDAGGYVLGSSSSLTDIPGFRLNNEEVAKFHFGDRADSYAAQLDKPQNIGVIAVIFYAERRAYRPALSMTKGGCLGGGHRSGGADTFGGAATRGGHDMGTEFGRRTDHKVTTTNFERAGEVGRFVIEYASRESLIAAGIIKDAPLGDVEPFPGFKDAGCKPPSGWKG